MKTIDDFTIPQECLSPVDDTLRDMVREWAEKEVIPYRREFDEDWEEHKLIAPAFKKLLVDLGFQKVLFPAEKGGLELSSAGFAARASFRIFLEVSRADSGMGVAFGCIFWALTMIGLAPHINEELLAEFAPKFTESDKAVFTCTAMTEPHGGADIENLDTLKGGTIRTTARLEGDEWVINGHKLWPTNSGGVADIFGVVCTTKPGSTDEKDFAFIFVPADAPGVKQGKPYQKMGMAADKNSDVWFDNVRVPRRYRAWGPGLDIQYFREVISWGCMGSIAFALGVMENIYEIIKDFCSTREYRGKPLKEDSAVAAILADIAAAIEVCSIIGWHYAGMLDKYELYGDKHSVEIATKGRMHKMFVADKAIEVAHKALSIMGRYGCDRDRDIEKHLRDVKMIQLWMGGKQLCQMEIARLFYDCQTL